MNEHYTDAAKALHDLADRLAAIADHTDLADAKPPYITVGVLPGHTGADPRNATIIDAVTQALLGRNGTDEYAIPGEGRRYKADGRVGPVYVSVHAIIPDPAAADLEAENARLRAELAALRGTDGGEPT